MDELVLVRRSGPAAEITINRPERRNALTFDTIEALRSALAGAASDPEVRAVVLTGAGESAFCSGADLGGIEGGDIGVLAAHEGRGQLAALFDDLWELGKPTIAKVRGYALAGGFGLALACDFVIATDDATFGTPEVDVGLWPYMITIPILRSMAPKVALDLMLTGRRVDAAEALRIGFVNDVVEPDRLDDRVDELVSSLARKSPTAIKLGRTAFYSVLDVPAAQALPHLHGMLSVAAATEDAAEGIKAFEQRRKPDWPGR